MKKWLVRITVSVLILSALVACSTVEVNTGYVNTMLTSDKTANVISMWNY